MGRRKKATWGDDGDSSNDDNNSGEEDYAGMNPDEMAEMRLFQNSGGGRQRRFTKEDAALGVFGEDDDPAPNSFRGAPSRRKLGEGIAFVKKAQMEDSLVREEDDSEDSDGEDAMDLDDQAREENARDMDDTLQMGAGLGLGMSNATSLAGFMGLNSTPNNNDIPTPSSSRAGLGSEKTVPSQFKSTKGNPKASTTSTKPILLDARKAAAAARRLNPTTDADFAKFDKDGKGMSFLLKMGYKPGHGLGKDGAGIVNPIDVKVRPKGAGIGARGFDERTETVKLEQARRRAERGGDVSSEEEEEGDVRGPSKKKGRKEDKVVADAWKRDDAASRRNKKNKVSYKTADQFLAEQQNALLSAPIAVKTKVIDMTGAQGARELDSVAEATSAARIAALKESAQHLLELRYNVRTMASEAEMDLVRLTRAMQLEAQEAERVEGEVSALERRARMVEIKKARLLAVKEVVGQIVEAGKKLERRDFSVELGGAAAVIADAMETAFSTSFHRLQTEFFDEYVEHRLDTLVVGVMTPLIKRMLVDWSPLDDPTFALNHFRSWRTLFRFSAKRNEPEAASGRVSADNMRSMTPYEYLMFHLWLPKVRQDVNNRWTPRNPDAVISFIEAWYPSSPSPEIIISSGLPELANAAAPHLLPPWLHANILNQLILPKLLGEIESWDPRNPQEPPPHTWLFPWLPVIPDTFAQRLSDPIKSKFSIYLVDWHPRDTPRALALLQPWVDVFTPKQLASLIHKGILPKLVGTLRHEFTINPAAQDNAPLLQALAWRTLVPQHLFAHLLETEFFPKWIQVLWLWLASPGVSFDEVSRWYSAWRNVLDEAGVADWAGVVEGFKVGLELMNRSLSLREGESLGPVPRLVPQAERGGEDGAGAATARKVEKEVTGKPELMRRKETADGFRELVERAAGKVGLALLPADRRVHASGKPLFRLVGEEDGAGKGVLFYMDEGVLFLHRGGLVGDEEGVWEATAIDKVIGMALARAK